MSDEQGDGVTRRQALAVGLVGAATLAAASSVGGGTPQAGPEEPRKGSGGQRMPVVFMPHGGGPWPFVDLGFGDQAGLDALAGYLRSVRALPKTPPRALLVVSAHWEEPVPTVMTSPRPPMLYDYYGFPPESYQLTWPAPGEPKLATRVQELLGAAGFQTATDASRGYDHGTFVPLKLTYPDAEVPTVQLSLKRGLDPREHLAMGRALAPLRDEGVFIIGSGMTYHDLRNFFGPSARGVSETFDAWLREAATLEPEERDQRLTQWSTAPAARQAHPREEHLLPLMVIAGAAGEDRGSLAYNGTMRGIRLSAYHFG
ncbi:dioxygenase [Archangium gephyra]|uniref:DODA-type extradiol aromatic ring-opening family dioxygenase n=1 Tax=Archangium gephyra TaxID=48 RepID=UPI0035D4E744